MIARARAPAAVSVTGLHFRHGDGEPLFAGFAFEVRPGERLALTGASGRGKSTLLALVAGLVEPEAGEIRIEGLAMAGAQASAARSRLGWMGQRPHVFAGSVRSNITLGRSDVTETDLARAMTLAQLDNVAQAHPGSTLGENGAGLSGGELVRLALARLAAAPAASVLLVDEPTAHLDSDTATRVTDALLELARGRTLIVATHDPRLIRRLDRAICLDDLALKEAA